MTWELLAEFDVRREWLYTPVVEGQFFRLHYLGYPPSTAIQIGQAQLLNGPEHYDIRRYPTKPYFEIVEFFAPPFFQARQLVVCGVGVRPDFNPIQLRIEVNTMPISNPANVTVNMPVSSSVTPTTINSQATSQQLIAANSSRKGLTVWNNSTATLYLELGSTASATVYSVKLDPGGYWESPFNYTGQVSGIWSAANGNALVREFV